MNNGRSLSNVFVIVLALALVGLFWWVSYSNKDKFRWIETYESTDEQPYGSSVMHELMEQQFPGKKFSEIKLPFNKDSLPQEQDAIYMYVGMELYLDSLEQEQLLHWIEKGNTAFISAKAFPANLLTKLYDLSCPEYPHGNTIYYYDTNATANFYHPKLKSPKGTVYHFQDKDEKMQYDFGGFDSLQFCANSPFEPLGYFEPHYVNYIRVKYGKGQFLLHCVPLCFSNYHLINPARAEYAAKALSYVPPGNIYWDEFHREPHNEDGQKQLRQPSETPLSFILGNESLRWSFYILLSLGALYLLFYTRRRQRIIPIIETPRNASLEFVQSIGRLYFHQRSHPTLLRHQMRYFHSFIRERYRISANPLNKEQMQLIALRSGVDFELIEKILTEYDRLKSFVVLEDKEVIEFYKLLSQFYSLAK